MKFNLLVHVLLLASASISFGAILPVSGNSEFVAIGKPSALKIHGQGPDGLTGNLEINNNAVTGKIKFKMDTMVTGVELRDHHMKEKYLETKTYPEADLTIDKLSLLSNPQVEGFKSEGLAFAGQLTLHGVTHPVNGTIDLKTSSGVTKGDGQFELKLSDYKIDVPSYLGITVADTVSIKVHLETKKANGSI